MFLRWVKYYLFKKKRNAYINEMYKSTDPWSSALTHKDLQKNLDSLWGAHKFNNCLDVGCGEGLFTEFLREHCISYTGVDISEVALNRARHVNTQTQTEYLNMDFDQLSHLKKKYDLIFFNFVLDYLGFQDFPHVFASNMYQILQLITEKNSQIVIFNPVYKLETWDRLQKYQYIIESFGYKTLKREMISVPDMQIGFLVLVKTK